MKRLIGCLLALLFLACEQEQQPELFLTRKPDAITARLERYAQVTLPLDEALPGPEQRSVVRHLVRAAREIDSLFWQQSFGGALTVRAALQATREPADSLYLRLLDINYGPFDRSDGLAPFIGTAARPPGAGLYPADLDRDELDRFLAANPSARDAFLRRDTVIKRDGTALISLPYTTVYQDRLAAAAAHLRLAARAAGDSLLRNYLELRADALISGDTFASDMAWMALRQNQVDIVIGAYDSDEDALLGVKAVYQAVVMIRDAAQSERLAKFLRFINELEARLPVPRAYRKAYGAPRADIGIFNAVLLAGRANAGPKPIALSLPEDQRVHALLGSRSILLRNVILAKYEHILLPLAAALQPELRTQINGDAFLVHHLLHELAHPLGLTYVRDQNGVTTRTALAETFPVIEEAKADLLGLYNVGYFVQRRVLPAGFEQKAYATFLAGLLRSLRLDPGKNDARTAMLLYNALKHEGAITVDGGTGLLDLRMAGMQKAVRKLAAELLTIMGDGDIAGARRIVAEMAVMPAEVDTLLARLQSVPQDLAFSFDAGI